MRIAFVHDHPFLEMDGEFYSQGGLPKNIWGRYLRLFDEVAVIGRRLKSHKNTHGLVLSSTDNVTFHLIDKMNSPLDAFIKRGQIKNDLKKVLKNCDAAVIRLPSELGFLAVDICRTEKVPYLLEVVGCAWDSLWNYGSIFGKMLAPVSYVRMKASVKNAAFSIYVTQQFLQQRYPSRGKVVGISDASINTANEDVLNARLNKIAAIRNGDPLKIGLIGSMFVKYKGHQELLKAVALLKDRFNFQLYFVGQGDGEWIKALAAQLGISDKVHLLYRLEAGEAIFNFLDGIDLYVHPARVEGLPRVVVEAISRACPSLTSDIGGLHELTDSRFIHHAGDYKTLADQLAVIAANPSMMEEMARKNFERAAEYDQNVLSKRRTDFLQDFHNHVSMNSR